MKTGAVFLIAVMVSTAYAADDVPSTVSVHEGERVTIIEYHPKDLRERVEVEPVNGRPYVLIDSDGNGELDRNSGDPSSNDGLMMWSIRKW
ncbi:MAG: DUF2782 domain-containing protein [Sedimenticolaceae bacterium]|nr:DUF2782 domain-containing protein [Sedimenticolaceae bacterium]